MRWWLKLILGLALAALLVWAAVQIGGLTVNVVKSFTDDSGEPDPMFAEEAERVTKPPELEDVAGASRFQDNSANWDVSVQTPVDQTAGELTESENAANLR